MHPNNPPQNHNQRQNQQRNLHTRAHCNPNRKIHLILTSNRHSSRMLRRIAHNRQQNQPDKGLTDIPRLRQRINRVNHELRTNSNKHSRDTERQQRNPDHQLRLLGLIVGVLELDLLCVLPAHCVRGHAADLGEAPAGVAFADALAPFLDFAARLVVHVCVGFELEEEVAAVDY